MVQTDTGHLTINMQLIEIVVIMKFSYQQVAMISLYFRDMSKLEMKHNSVSANCYTGSREASNGDRSSTGRKIFFLVYTGR